MKLKLTLITLLFSLHCIAQDYNVDMQVYKSDVSQTSYARDSTANALVIYDYGNSFIDKETFWLRCQVKQKIKILKAEGIDRGEIEVKLYKGKSSKERIKNIKGATYNSENDEMVKTILEPSAIFREENENYTLVKFVLPKVKVGSVITYSYETQSRFITKYQPWYFQGPDPVLYSEYNTSIPANYDYHVKLVGGRLLDVNDVTIEYNCLEVGRGGAADCTIRKYVMTDIPAYKPESYTTTSLNYISRIEYELNEVKRFDGGVDKLSKTWDDVDKELKTDADFGRQIGKRSLVKNLLPSDIMSIEDQLEKAKTIYQFVLENYTWNGKSERYDVSVKELLKEKNGSVFEINILLENLLNSEGFQVYPVLISTRENGLPTTIYPILTDFNYLILKTTINGKDYFLDATDPYLEFGELPFRCLNQYGRLMDFENESSWEDIKPQGYSLRSHRVNLNFEDDAFFGKVESKFTGYHSHGPKQGYLENPIAYKEGKINSNADFLIENHEVLDFDKTKSDFKEILELSIEPEIIGNKIYLNPFIFKFFTENPFKLEERSYPIDFGYKDIYSYSMKLHLGENLKVAEIPSNISQKLPNNSGTFIFNVESNGNNELTLYFKVKFDLAIYAPEYYDYLKKFMSQVVENQNNTTIVLEK
ncbi:DUF3857 domain-containing protein [Winogradskyella flava]|uniref:DUF3857 domain-containing protein n=1 Tax=Winogradskyella flava TaxID=1884876 RepID=A0A842IQH3_9FLAO|nr:DUF3857 domain-containing protein [Winogradskyella flava]MBC2845462.1 DUF3857 domain-containing protein [Winogradskyella flava]